MGSIYFHHSGDFGPTWSSDVFVATGDSPSVAIFPDDLLVESYENGGTCYLRESNDNGDTWSAAFGTVTGMNPYLWVSQDGAILYRVYYDSGQVKFQYSTDVGATWSSAVNIAASVNAAAPTGISLADEVLQVVWRDGATTYYYYNETVDGSGAWTAV